MEIVLDNGIPTLVVQRGESVAADRDLRAALWRAMSEEERAQKLRVALDGFRWWLLRRAVIGRPAGPADEAPDDVFDEMLEDLDEDLDEAPSFPQGDPVPVPVVLSDRATDLYRWLREQRDWVVPSQYGEARSLPRGTVNSAFRRLMDLNLVVRGPVKRVNGNEVHGYALRRALPQEVVCAG